MLHSQDYLLYEVEIIDNGVTRIVKLAAQGEDAGNKMERYITSGSPTARVIMRNAGTVRVL